jgi:CAAX protease family protein
MINKKALIDVFTLLIVFWVSWYFRSLFPVEFQGPFIVITTSIVAVIILKLRHLSFNDIGLIKRNADKVFAKEVIFVAVLIFAVQFIGILITTMLFGSPEAGNAVTSQPKTVIGFLLDNIFVVWIITGFGEEFIFRGIILNRLNAVFANHYHKFIIYVISGIQALWFGAGHQSQGISGMITAGLIGFALGIYILKNPKRGLWPLIIAHGLIDTIVLTIYFIK